LLTLCNCRLMSTEQQKKVESKAIFVVSGCSRGIGLELVRQIAEGNDNFVFACVRNPDSASDLKAIQAKSSNRVELVALDVEDQKSIQAAVEKIKGRTDRVNVLINNAGVSADTKKWKDGCEPIEAVGEALLPVLQTNVFGLQAVTVAFLPLLKAAVKGEGKDKKTTDVPKVVNISSIMGSLEKNRGAQASYRISKVAVNMLTSCWAIEVPDIAFIPIHPGWVDTDMGRLGGTPAVKPHESAKGVLNVTEKSTLEDSGKKLFNYDGTIIPW